MEKLGDAGLALATIAGGRVAAIFIEAVAAGVREASDRSHRPRHRPKGSYAYDPDELAERFLKAVRRDSLPKDGRKGDIRVFAEMLHSTERGMFGYSAQAVEQNLRRALRLREKRWKTAMAQYSPEAPPTNVLALLLKSDKKSPS
jgi:hypothetical protein